jgi:hypothetical protein
MNSFGVYQIKHSFKYVGVAYVSMDAPLLNY